MGLYGTWDSTNSDALLGVLLAEVHGGGKETNGSESPAGECREGAGGLRHSWGEALLLMVVSERAGEETRTDFLKYKNSKHIYIHDRSS